MRTGFVTVLFLSAIIKIEITCDSSENCHTKGTESEELKRKKEPVDSSSFKPTHEWQNIKEGQAIPRGLHIRLNLETGKREAKLPYNNERTDLTLVPGDAQGRQVSQEQLEAALKNLPGEDSLASVEDSEHMWNSFRSYETLKKDFEALNLTVKTDLELLNELMNKFKSGGDDQKLLNILTDLEYLVHQFDNGQKFAQMGGLMDVVLPSLNASSTLVRSEAVRLLGSAAQSNIAVQIVALESGSISAVLRVLALDQDPTVRSRALYALSCLVRRFPTALIKMLADGGLEVLATLFQNEAQDNLKLQVKVVTLLHDLVLEVKEAEEAWQSGSQETSKHPDLQEKRRQYRAAGLIPRLVEKGWCTHLIRLLHASPSTIQHAGRKDELSSSVEQDIPVQPEHDIIEKVVSAMLALADVCVDRFQDARDALIKLHHSYQELALHEELEKKKHKDGSRQFYYADLAEQVAFLAAQLELHKDEL